MEDLKVIKHGDIFDCDMGHGVETVQCAGRSKEVPAIIGFYTTDGGLFVVNERDLCKFGLKFDDGAVYKTKD